MSYNRHTRLNHCDVCSLSEIDTHLFVYFKHTTNGSGGPAHHLCDLCIKLGNYYCLTCQEIHRFTDTCEQHHFLFDLNGGDSTPVEQI